MKKAKIDNLNREYELFRMKEVGTIQDMHTTFTAILNEIYSLGEHIPTEKAVRKLLRVFPESWKSSVEAITTPDLMEGSKPDNDIAQQSIETTLALMAVSGSEQDDTKVCFSDLKPKLHIYSKRNLNLYQLFL